MSSFSLRLTYKITAIGVIGVIGVILVGGIHLYGEFAAAVYRAAAETRANDFRTEQQDRSRIAGGPSGRKGFSASQ